MKVLVVNACALHLGYIGCYGNEWIETPNFDRLAAEGVVFDQHFSDNPGAATEGPHRFVWTGRYRLPLPGGEDTSAEGEPLHANFSLDSLGSVPSLLVEPRRPGLSALTAESLRKRILQDTLAGLDRLAANDRWLLGVDLPSLAPPWQVPDEFLDRYFPEGAEEDEDPLTPWLNPPPGPLDTADATALERLQNTYAAAVNSFDAHLGRLLEELDERGLKDQVLLCVTAARGLALGEHGIIGDYWPWLHDEVVRLPLILRLPGGEEAGRRVPGLTQPVDMPPTILEALGLPLPPSFQGQSLWPLLRGEKEQVRAYACSGWRLGEHAEWALRTPEWAFLLPGDAPSGLTGRGPQLYVKPDDRWEVNNVIQHHLETAEHLQETMLGFVQATTRPGPLQPPELRVLEAETTPAASPDGTTP
jgi:arylsulfatase A-like enzyme